MPYNNYTDFDKRNPKLQLALLNGINNPPTPSFFVYFNDDSVVLECLKLKFFGAHKVISTYTIPFDRVITMNVVAEDDIDEIEQKYRQQFDLKSNIFNKAHETIKTLCRFKSPNSPPADRIIVLSLAYYSAEGEINDVVFSISNCGFDIANDMAMHLRVKLGIESPNKPKSYFLNDKGEYVL